MQKYEVWLELRHQKTLEIVAAVRVFCDTDRLKAERAVEQSQALFQPLVLSLLNVHPGALVSAAMWIDHDGEGA